MLATFDNNMYLQKQVEKYNQTHDDYRIEIQRYERSEQIEEDGVLKLQREIISGEGPDIIDFGSGYTTSDIVGEYTEDLFPYMETENQGTYFDKVLRAFSYGENLYAVPLGFTMKIYDICEAETIFDENEVSFIGFPVEGTCGTVLQSCGPVLAINRNSTHKDVAWNFVSWCLSKSAQIELPSGFPICRRAFEEQIAEAMQMEYKTDEDGTPNPVVKKQVIFEGEDPVNIYCISQKQADQLLALIESTEISSSTDHKLYNIFWEEVEYYFRGSKELEETADVIQSRISMYVNEKIK